MAPKKGQQKKSSNQPSRVASGASTPAVRAEPKKAEPAVIGINFGQSFSSVAVINKEGLADCIANDDGERQIASALSFNGSEEYFGVPARVQLVRNAENTILAFRNLLGKSYDQVKDIKQPYNSAPIVNASGSAGFTVQINDAAKTLSVHECAVRYLTTLVSYASDFLGRPISSAVMSVPVEFDQQQTAALVAAAEEAKIKVVQTISEPAAALTAYHSSELTGEDANLALDRNVIVLDVGASSSTSSVVAVRDGLFVPLSSVTDSKLGGDLFDAKLIDWFAKEFTKKTKTPLEASNHRAQLKLRLAVEITKKSLSASNSAPCSVESLAEGLDFHGSINRTRFDLLSAAIYSKIVDLVESSVQKANLDPIEISQVILVGGTTRLPTLADKLLNLLPESTKITSQLDSDEVIARGAALQAQTLLDAQLKQQLEDSLKESTVTSPPALSQPIGLVVEGKFHLLVPSQTPLPFRRIFNLSAAPSASQLLIELHEGESSVVSKPPPAKPAKKTGWFGSSKPADEDEDSEDEPEEIKEIVYTAKKHLTDLIVVVDSKLKGKDSKVLVTLVVEKGGKGIISALQGKGKLSQTSF